MRPLLPCLIYATLTACSTAANRPLQLPTHLAGLSGQASLACHYHKQGMANGQALTAPTDWYFWRDDTHTETRDEASQQGERWERDTRGQLSHTQLFFDRKLAVEYNTVDLLTLGINPDWQQLRSLIPPGALQNGLRRLESSRINGMQVDRYSGTLDGMTAELDWLPALQLPARLYKAQDGKEYRLELEDCRPAGQFSVKPGSALTDFRHLEYTDLGDMESDPDVERLHERMDGHHSAH